MRRGADRCKVGSRAPTLMQAIAGSHVVGASETFEVL